MFGQGTFAGQWFGGSCCCTDEPPPTPTPSFGGPGDIRERIPYDRRDDDDDVALITALLDL